MNKPTGNNRCSRQDKRKEIEREEVNEIETEQIN